jgi:hypothetical protein
MKLFLNSQMPLHRLSEDITIPPRFLIPFPHVTTKEKLSPYSRTDLLLWQVDSPIDLHQSQVLHFFSTTNPFRIQLPQV